MAVLAVKSSWGISRSQFIPILMGTKKVMYIQGDAVFLGL